MPRRTVIVSALPLVLSLALVLARLSRAQQSGCGDISNVKISFKESDNRPPLNDPDYVKMIINTTEPVESLRVADTEGINSYPFNLSFKLGFANNSSHQGYFVQMIAAIDRDGPTNSVQDDVNIIQYTIECTETAATIFGVLKITIEDVNDNAPTFVTSPMLAFVPELSRFPSSVYQVSTNDIDEGPNAIVIYDIVSMPGATFDGTGVFDINPKSGLIWLNRSVDFESMYRVAGRDELRVRYEFIIIAKNENNEMPQTSTAPLTIWIEDDDDLSPTFSYPSCQIVDDDVCNNAKYESQIVSNDTSGSLLTFLPVPRGQDEDETVTILARDGDALNSSIDCIIQDVQPPDYQDGYFDVVTSYAGANLYECAVYHMPNKPISRERHSDVELTLQVRETEFYQRSRYATLIIEVVSNDTMTSSPSFSTTLGPNIDILVISPSHASCYINENASLGTPVSSDEDLMTDCWFSFRQISPTGNETETADVITNQFPPSPFTVTQDGYVLVSSVALDFEIRQLYIFVFTITEQPMSLTTATATVTVTVLDANDNSPQFYPGSGSVRVEEGDYRNAEEFIFRFSVTDGDGSAPNNDVIVEMQSASPSEGVSKFFLEPNGELFLNGNVLAGDIYELFLVAKDLGIPQQRSFHTFTVHIDAATGSSDGISTGVLVGIAVGGFVIVALVIILISYFACRRRRNTKDRDGHAINPHGKLDNQRNQELNTLPKSSYDNKDQPYLYADGFIHKNSANPNDVTSAYDTISRQQEDEEVYDVINEADVDRDTYEQPGDLRESAYVTPTLPKRNNSNDYHPYLQPIGSSMENGKDPASGVNPDGNVVKAEIASRENSYLEPTVNTTETGNNTGDDISNLKPVEATKDLEGQIGDSEEPKPDYDILIPDDPNYLNLNRDPREYFRLKKDDQLTSL